MYILVHVDGGYFYLGDYHATQSDGELCGVAIEQATTTTLTVKVVEDFTLEWPRLESDDGIMSVGSACPMEDAARTAYADLIEWLAEDYGFDI